MYCIRAWRAVLVNVRGDGYVATAIDRDSQRGMLDYLKTNGLSKNLRGIPKEVYPRPNYLLWAQSTYISYRVIDFGDVSRLG